MPEILNNIPQIIEKAAQSNLGIFALMIIALSIIAFYFFRDASTSIRLIVFVLFFAGVVAFGAAVVHESQRQDHQIAPVLKNPSGRLHRIASNDHCQGNENNWVYITNDNSVKIGLVGVNLEEGRVDIRVIQTHDGKTTRDDPRLYRDQTLPFGVGNFEMYIKPQIDDCWVDYEIYATSK